MVIVTVAQESLGDNSCQNWGCPSRDRPLGVAQMSETKLNQPERAQQGAFFAALRPCSMFVSWCITLMLSLAQLFLSGCSGSDHSSATGGSGGQSTGGGSSAGATNAAAEGGNKPSGGQSAAGGGTLTNGGVSSAGGTGAGGGSSTSTCAALWSSCQSVNDCCSTGYQLVCNTTCQPALVASGGSTSVACLADYEACSTNAQCCSFYCSGGQCLTNAHIDLPTGGSPSTGGNSATGGTSSMAGDDFTGGKSSTGGITATGGTSSTGGASSTGGTTGLIACMPKDMGCSAATALACCSRVCSNSVCQ